MKRYTFYRILSIFLMLAAILPHTGCAPAYDVKNSSSESGSKPLKDAPPLTNPIELMKIYWGSESDEYKELDEKSTNLGKQPDLQQGGVAVKLVPCVDGLKVKIQSLEWNMPLDFFHVTKELTDTTMRPDEVYTFEAEITESIPRIRLVAEYRGLRGTWYFQYNATTGSTSLSLTGTVWKPQEITKDSKIISLCKSAIITSYFYENDYETYSPVEYWQTVECAVSFAGEAWEKDEYGYYIVPKWAVDAYTKALFPHIKGQPPIEGPELVTYDAKSETYIILPCDDCESLVTVELIGCEMNDEVLTASFFVTDIKRNTSWGMAATIEEIYEYEQDNPFEHRIANILTLGGDTP